MQIKKTYRDVKPELLYDELRDFVVKQGVSLGDKKFETYAVTGDSSSFIARATLTFKLADGRECLRAHLVGSGAGETKLLIDITDELFTPEKVAALQADLDFTIGSYEVKTPPA